MTVAAEYYKYMKVLRYKWNILQDKKNIKEQHGTKVAKTTMFCISNDISWIEDKKNIRELHGTKVANSVNIIKVSRFDLSPFKIESSSTFKFCLALQDFYFPLTIHAILTFHQPVHLPIRWLGLKALRLHANTLMIRVHLRSLTTHYANWRYKYQTALFQGHQSQHK